MWAIFSPEKFYSLKHIIEKASFFDCVSRVQKNFFPENWKKINSRSSFDFLCT